MTISTGIINGIGTILMIFLVPLSYIPLTMLMITIIGLMAGILEIYFSYRDDKEKIRDTTVLLAIGAVQMFLLLTAVEKFIKGSGLNLGNTLMNELVTGLMKVPAGTGFLIQALIFMGIVAGALSLIGLILRR
ncbi:MAG: hypothetical protein HXM49_01380 [Leptotrichia sp.]|nr:hypothetical protein [Leptotrichia sp.]